MMALLSVQQAAERLNVCPSTVYDLCARRKLRHVRIGGSGRGTIRIDEADLEAFIERAAVPPDEPAAPQAPPRNLKHLKLN
jgi:excisionase family DNA binding protein